MARRKDTCHAKVGLSAGPRHVMSIAVPNDRWPIVSNVLVIDGEAIIVTSELTGSALRCRPKMSLKEWSNERLVALVERRVVAAQASGRKAQKYSDANAPDVFELFLGEWTAAEFERDCLSNESNQ